MRRRHASYRACTELTIPLSAILTHYVPKAQGEGRKAPTGMKAATLVLPGNSISLPERHWQTMKDVQGEKSLHALRRQCAVAEETQHLGWVLLYNLFYDLQLSLITSQSPSVSPICKWRLIVPTQPFSKACIRNNTIPYQTWLCTVIYIALYKSELLLLIANNSSV